MPSSLNLFIRIPKGFSEQDVLDAIIKKDICKVIDVVIKTGKKGKTTNNAIIKIDYWYKGTRHIRDTLISGGPISIIVGSHMLLAYEFKTNPTIESAKVHPEHVIASVDEFGRDMPRQSKSVLRADAPSFKPVLRADAPSFKPVLRADAPAFIPTKTLLKIAPALSDINQCINKIAAKTFIRECEQNCLANQPQMNNKDAIATGAPNNVGGIKHDDCKEEGEIDDVQITITHNKVSGPSKKKTVVSNYGYATAAIKRKVRFNVPTNK